MKNYTLMKVCNLQVNDIQKLDYAIFLYKGLLTHPVTFVLIQETVLVQTLYTGQ